MGYRAFHAVAAAFLLASCAHVEMPRAGPPPPPDPHRPWVFVIDGNIAINQDPLVFRGGDNGAITWKLHGAGHTFPENGITVESNEFKCRRENDTTFVCTNAHTKAGRYKYTIRALDNGKPLDPLDPIIVNG